MQILRCSNYVNSNNFLNGFYVCSGFPYLYLTVQLTSALVLKNIQASLVFLTRLFVYSHC